jgi:tetratricopeptide (TPR) repeat protein
MNSALHLLIDLNNEGVRFLANGKFEKAAAVLCAALLQAKDLVYQEEKEKEETQGIQVQSKPIKHHPSPCPSSYPSSKIVEVNIDACHPYINGGLQAETYSRGRNGFIFRNAYKLRKESCAKCHKSGIPSSFACMFNLALTHHLWALEESSNQEAFLIRAVRLYELAYGMIMQDGVDLNGNEMISLAIVNNLAIAHDTLKNEQKATRCFEHLLSLLMFYREYGDIHTAKLSSPILSTVVHLLLNDPLTSPAA